MPKRGIFIEGRVRQGSWQGDVLVITKPLDEIQVDWFPGN
jgi:hypothetical protein